MPASLYQSMLSRPSNLHHVALVRVDCLWFGVINLHALWVDAVWHGGVQAPNGIGGREEAEPLMEEPEEVPPEDYKVRCCPTSSLLFARSCRRHETQTAMLSLCLHVKHP